MKRVLVVDPMVEGHHADYLVHLLRFAQSGAFSGELIFLVEEAFAPIWRREVGDNALPTVQVHYFNEADRVEWMRYSMIRRSWVMWRLVRDWAQRLAVDHILLMYMDIPQLGVALGPKPSQTVSGILFRPNFHYQVQGWKSQVGQWGKKNLLAFLLRRTFVQTLWTLDATAVAAASFGGQQKFKTLADPVLYREQTDVQRAEGRRRYKWPENTKVFLLFGHLDERKGISVLLEAITLLSPDELKQATFLLAGNLSPHITEEVAYWLPKAQAVADVRTEFRALSGEEIDILFDLSDYILALYQRHIGMASVVVRAAYSGKPMWASDFGYLGHLVKSQSLGVVVNSEDPQAVAQSLRTILTHGISVDPKALKKIAEASSPEEFAKRLLGILP